MWVPGSSGIIGAGDYDGVFAEWDIEKGLCMTEREEHEGQRIWSVDYSQWMGSNGKPMSVTASNNGAVCLWSADSEDSVGTIRLASGKRAICSAKFGPTQGGENFLALAGADSKVYLYDLRNFQEPLFSLAGHQRTVSFVRFMGPGSLVSSSVDSTVKLWDVTGSNPSNGVSTSTSSPSRTPKVASGSATSDSSNLPVVGVSNNLRASCDDHLNVRNFVGLSVRELDGGSSFCRSSTTRCGKGTSGSAGGSRAGLIATGSESNELVIYHVDSKSRCSCVLKFDFGFAKLLANHGSCDTKGRSKTPPLEMTGRESSSGGEMRGSGSGSGGGGGNVFVSAVGWQQRPESDLLAAANSQGVARAARARAATGTGSTGTGSTGTGSNRHRQHRHGQHRHGQHRHGQHRHGQQQARAAQARAAQARAAQARAATGTGSTGTGSTGTGSTGTGSNRHGQHRHGQHRHGQQQARAAQARAAQARAATGTGSTGTGSTGTGSNRHGQHRHGQHRHGQQQAQAAQARAAQARAAQARAAQARAAQARAAQARAAQARQHRHGQHRHGQHRHGQQQARAATGTGSTGTGSNRHRQHRHGQHRHGQHKHGQQQAGQHRAAQAGQHRAAQAGQHRAAQAGQYRAAQAGQYRAAQAGQHRACGA
ncbi:unnamed protein product [Closterium sp. NIES-64]|nr:unnamed protein product [Closterium sp. NIES-64]